MVEYVNMAIEKPSLPLTEIYGDEKRITNIFYWFISLILAGMISGLVIVSVNTDYTASTIIVLTTIPVIASYFLVRQRKFEAAAIFLSSVIIILVTLLATNGQGIHHISNLGYPAILIVASLVTRKRSMVFLTGLTILCVAWLVFGELNNLYTPHAYVHSVSGDFYSTSVIILATAVMARIISESLFQSLLQLRGELDIRQRIQKEHEELIKELESKNAELERFTYTVSHDLKSPLVTINGFLNYLQSETAKNDPERFEHDKERIQEAVDKMHILLGELLELSRIGRIANPSQSIPFDELVGDTLKLTQGQLDLKGIRLEIHPGLPAVYGDRQRLTEVLQNLVDNASKFMGSQTNPRIEIGSEGDENDMPIFYVRDNGVGIPKELQERIFGLFEKLDPKSEGSGVGLAIVKRIIEVHGGRIWVEGEPGKGSTFLFTLPRAK